MKSDMKFNSVLPRVARLFTRGATESTSSELKDAVEAVRRRTWKTFEVAMMVARPPALNSSYTG